MAALTKWKQFARLEVIFIIFSYIRNKLRVHIQFYFLLTVKVFCSSPLASRSLLISLIPNFLSLTPLYFGRARGRNLSARALRKGILFYCCRCDRLFPLALCLGFILFNNRVEPPAFLILLFSSCISVANPINTHLLSFFLASSKYYFMHFSLWCIAWKKNLLCGKHKILFSCASAKQCRMTWLPSVILAWFAHFSNWVSDNLNRFLFYTKNVILMRVARVFRG